jgi:hypothetical protein
MGRMTPLVNSPLVCGDGTIATPAGCTLQPDGAVDVPLAWEVDPKWSHRNDIKSIVYHNLGVQLMQAHMLESAKGAVAGVDVSHTAAPCTSHAQLPAFCLLLCTDMWRRVSSRGRRFGSARWQRRCAVTSAVVLFAADVEDRISMVDWSWTTRTGRMMFLFGRLALNSYSIVFNIVDLPPRDSTESYNLARYVTFWCVVDCGRAATAVWYTCWAWDV